MADSLIVELKLKLNITWSDADTEDRLAVIIADAAPTLKMKLGADDIDFSAPGPERNLFLNYCMYEWNHCLDDFDVRYMNDIMQIRGKYEVKQYDEKQAEIV